MRKVLCRGAIIEETLESLRSAGNHGTEGVVMWLSNGIQSPISIAEIFVPQYSAGELYFEIPPDGMRGLMRYLRAKRLALAVQVHSHPRRAFHSWFDDRDAVPRHVGALSIVVPRFANHVSINNFKRVCAFYRLSGDNHWLRILRNDLSDYFEIETP